MAAAAAGLTIETRSSIPSVTAITGWATAAGILLALCILAMSIGLIRSETASDLRILTATGATGPTRRMITAATAGTLGLAGAVLGTAAGYLGTIAWFRDSPQDGLSALASVPVWNLVIILAGLPLAACGSRLAAGGPRAGRDRAPADRVTPAATAPDHHQEGLRNRGVNPAHWPGPIRGPASSPSRRSRRATGSTRFRSTIHSKYSFDV